MTPDDRAERRAWLAAALIISLGFAPLIWALDDLTAAHLPQSWSQSIGAQNYTDVVGLILGLCVALSTPRSSGLGFGHPGRNWKPLLALMIAPVVIAAIVVPRLMERPFAGKEVGAWLISPVCEELLFTGFLYGSLERHFPNSNRSRFRVPEVVILTAVCFSLHHVWNLGSSKMSINYAVFQLGYTFVGGLVHSLIRCWSGSIWYAVIVHMAVNWIGVHG
jgi:membrane protease YdiL (CAAX protease family)